MAIIHPTAVVHDQAELGPDVEIGPYSIVGPHVRVGEGTRIMPHVFLDGHTTVGAHCTIFPFASVGAQTQDLKFKGGNPRVEIGDRTTIRESATIHAATFDDGVTRVGSRCHIMAYAHVAHDCVVGDEVIMANCATLAGHVIVEDQVIVGGLTGVHQFVRLGRLCIIGGCAKVTQDVPPFMMADGNPVAVRGINTVGLKRKGVDEEAQRVIKQAYRMLYRDQLSTSQALDRICADLAGTPEIDQLTTFIKLSERGISKG